MNTKNFQFGIIYSYTLQTTCLLVISFCDSWKFTLFGGKIVLAWLIGVLFNPMNLTVKNHTCSITCLSLKCFK